MSSVVDQPTSEASVARHEVTVLEVRVVTGAGGGPDKTILNTPRLLDPLGYRTVCAYMHPPDDPGFDVLIRRAQAAGRDWNRSPIADRSTCRSCGT